MIHIKIGKILATLRPESNFNNSEDFQIDGLLDSMDMIILVSELEKEFNVIISGESIVPENFNNLESIARLVNETLENSK